MSVRTQVRQWLKRTLDDAGRARSFRRGSRAAVERLENRTLLSAVQIDFSGVFNQDSIRNRTGGVDDITDTTVDGNALLVTDAYAQNQSPSGNGLPNNGTFAANAHHPHIQLGYSNDNNGKNVVLLQTMDAAFTVPVPAETYDRIDLLAMSVLGFSDMDVTLNYSDGTVTASTLVEDWFDEVTEGNTEGDAISYYLIDGMDRWDRGSFADVDDPAVFGLRFPVDPARVLQSITVTQKSVGSGLVVLGATANTTRYIVDSLDGSSDGDFSPGNFSLREAIELANASSTVNPDVITFAPFLTGTISITSELSVTDNVRIIGPGADMLSISGGNTATRIFRVDNSDASLINVAISGLTIRDAGDGTTEFFGAGLRSAENLTLEEVAVLNNDSATTGGGGIAISAGSLLLMSSLVSGNRANQGGGIEVSFSAVSATIINSTISGNSAKSFGGGIEVVVGTATIRNSTITGNRADIDNSGNENGGGVDGNPGLITLHNSIVADNFQGTGSVASDVGNTLAGSSSFNLICDAGSAGGLTDGINGNIVGNSGSGTRNINTILNTTLASNGGPTLTHALLLNSPAFNRGNNALAVNAANGSSPLTTDQRGVGFSRIQFGIVDMGALESTVLDSPEGTTGADAFVLTYSATTTAGTVTVTVSTASGPVVNLGTFPMNAALTIDGLGGTDSVRVVGTSGADTIIVNSSTGLVVNGASLILTSIENRTLAGAAGSDVYKFDADTALGLWTLDESGGGIDTVDFTPTTTVGLNLNMGFAAAQVVHTTNLSLALGSAATFENLIGGAGADTLFGNSLNNTLTGGPGDDKLIGAAGNDLLLGGTHNDTYIFVPATAAEADEVRENSNEGIDTLNFGYLTTSVMVHLGANSVQQVHTNRTLKLNSATVFENTIGGSGADTLFGNSLNNTLTGNAGNDKLLGAGGNDLLLGGANDDTYMFVPATAAEADEVRENSNEGIDTLNFGYLTTSVVAHLGSSSIQSVHTNRTLKLNSALVFENLDGGSGADTLFGNTLNNYLTGGAGDDKLLGAGGNDVMRGGANNDTYMFVPATSAEADQVIENANEGIDTLNFGYLTTSVVVNLGSTSFQTVNLNRTLRLNSLSTFENALGGTASDILLGNAVANRLTGGSGHNVLVGMEGRDILEAGSGRDILIGGLGLDILKGDAGDDILIAGRTTNDTNLSGLNTLRAQWISGNAYATRITNLRAGVGSPVVSLKAKINVLNDAGEDDVLYGGTGTDWFFRAVDDVFADLVSGEIHDLL